MANSVLTVSNKSMRLSMKKNSLIWVSTAVNHSHALMADMEVIISGALISTAVPVPVFAPVLVFATITSRADGAAFESVHNYSHLTPFLDEKKIRRRKYGRKTAG